VTNDLLFTQSAGTIAYADQGRGPLVLMVPGLGDLKEEYRFLVPKLVAAGYRAVTMDLRGHGNSSVGWPDYSNAALGSDIVALLKYLRAPTATVIGTSMGAGAAAWAAAEAPQIINDLVVIGPFVRVLPLAPWWQRAMLKAAFAGPWAIAMWGSYWTSLYPTSKPDDFAAYKAKLLANLREPGRMAATKTMIAATKADVGDRLVEVRSRTLVVMGSLDPDFPDPAAEAATIAKLLRGTSVMIPGAGHYPQAEMADLTAVPILAFLASDAPSVRAA
jgi:pimeloyl-ACP methyl ester carboxylesterase